MQDQKNDDVSLEPFTEKHLDLTYTWMQDEQLKKDFLFASNITPEKHLTWFQNYSSDESQAIFAIYFENVHVGNLGLKQTDNENHSAETWIYLGDKNIKNKGVASKAYSAFLNIVRTQLNLESLYCFIAVFNTASEKLYLKVGFVQDQSFVQKKQWENDEYVLNKYTLIL